MWGGWGSNPRPADYEKYGPPPRVRYLHGHHGVVPPVALIALSARVTRSTNRPRLTIAVTGCRLQNVTASRSLMCQGYGRRATWSIWTTRSSLSIV